MESKRRYFSYLRVLPGPKRQALPSIAAAAADDDDDDDDDDNLLFIFHTVPFDDTELEIQGLIPVRILSLCCLVIIKSPCNNPITQLKNPFYGSIPGGGWEFFSSPLRPERLWVPPSLLFNG
jgi:hypothetical protein